MAQPPSRIGELLVREKMVSLQQLQQAQEEAKRTGKRLGTTLARLGFDSIVVDKLLAHQPGKLRGVAAVYQRHDFAKEQAAALDAWAAHVVPSPVASNVVKLAVIG